MKKLSFIIIAILIMVPIFTACSGGAKSSSEGEIKVVDQLGREVVFDKPAEKVASSYYISTSMVLALGKGDTLVGLEGNASKMDLYKQIGFKYEGVESIRAGKAIDLEKLASLKPDVIIIPARAKNDIKSIEDIGVKVIAINPESEEEWKESINILAKALGAEEKGKELVEFYESKASKLKDLLKDTEKVRVYLGGNKDLYSTASDKMYQSSQIKLAGGENVAAEIDDVYWAQISNEQLITYNPDVIILASNASYTIEDVKNENKQLSLKAISDGKVYRMPSTYGFWDSPVDSTILGSLWIASVIHPDEYTREEFLNDVKEFYDKFYGIEVNEI